MTHKLFDKFPDDASIYDACERYWERLVRDVEKSLNQTDEWERWLIRQYPDGAPVEMDGNPIYDGRSRKTSRAFRVLQHRPISDDVEIVAWLKTYPAEYEELPREELVLNLSLSVESEEIAKKLLTIWMSPFTTFDQMTQVIRPYLGI